jgi:1-acyl-sn-glycerol-3-phosphate acyltransferase
MPQEKVFFLWPHKLEIHFLQAVPIAKDDTVQSLRERVFDIMARHFLAHNH